MGAKVTTSPISAEGRDRLGEGYRHEVIGTVLFHQYDPVAGPAKNGAHLKLLFRSDPVARNRSDSSEDGRPAGDGVYPKFFPCFGMSANEWRHEGYLRIVSPHEEQIRFTAVDASGTATIVAVARKSWVLKPPPEVRLKESIVSLTAPIS